MKKNQGRVFDLIAPVYGWFFRYQTRRFELALDGPLSVLALGQYRNILDVGCGTGALCSVLEGRGYDVTGVDVSGQMLKVARRKTAGHKISFIQAGATRKLPLQDKSFAVSVAAHVAHGLDAAGRKSLYGEMKRVTKHLILIYDYNETRSCFVDLIEWLEGGDYFRFIQTARQELRENFDWVDTVPAGRRTNCYVCRPDK